MRTGGELEVDEARIAVDVQFHGTTNWCQYTPSAGDRLVHDEGSAIGEVMDHLRVDADQAYNTSRAVGNDAEERREELAGLQRDWDNLSRGWSGVASSALAQHREGHRTHHHLSPHAAHVQSSLVLQQPRGSSHGGMSRCANAPYSAL